MYNIFHSASAPGAADAFRPRRGRLGARVRRRRRRLPRVGAVTAARPRRDALNEPPSRAKRVLFVVTRR